MLQCCVNAISFFGFVQTFFNFFSASTHRWSILKSTIHGVIKSLSTTRWSARADATHSLKENFVEILSALIQFAEDEGETASNRSEASSLVSKMQDFEIGFLCVTKTEVQVRDIILHFRFIDDRINEKERSLLQTTEQVWISLSYHYSLRVRTEGSCFQFAATFLYRCGAHICRRVHSDLWIQEVSSSRNVFTPICCYEAYSKCMDL